MSVFYERFIGLCVGNKVAPSRVAEENGFSRTAPNGWKNGKQPNDFTIRILAEYFGTTPDYLLGKEDEQKKPAPENRDELDLVEMVGRLTNDELYDLIDAANRRLRELNK